jgi:hypothetical protein
MERAFPMGKKQKLYTCPQNWSENLAEDGAGERQETSIC